MAPTSIAGIHLRLIRSAKRTFKFPDTIEVELRSVLHKHNIRGTFSIRSLRATKGSPHRKGFVWTAVDESEGLIRFIYQPGDNNTCVRYTLTPDECTLALSEMFRLLRSGEVAVPRSSRIKAGKPTSVPAAAVGQGPVSMTLSEPTEIDPADVLALIDLPPGEVRQRLVEVAAMLQRADVVKTEMHRLAVLYAEEKVKLRRIQELLDNSRYSPILTAFESSRD